MVYQFREGARMHGDPQKVGEEIDSIRAKHGGSVLPVQIVAKAKSPSSILHGYFEWDDTEASRRFREDQARALLRSIVVCSESEDFPPTRAFVVVVEEEASYHHITDVVENDEHLEQVLNRAKRAVKAWRLRYKNLQHFSELFRLIDAI